MKKLIAAAVIATAAFGAQQASAMGLGERICHGQTESAMENFYQRGYDGQGLMHYMEATESMSLNDETEILRNMARGKEYNLFAYRAGQNHENYFIIKEQIFDVCMMNVEEPQL